MNLITASKAKKITSNAITPLLRVICNEIHNNAHVGLAFLNYQPEAGMNTDELNKTIFILRAKGFSVIVSEVIELGKDINLQISWD